MRNFVSKWPIGSIRPIAFILGYLLASISGTCFWLNQICDLHGPYCKKIPMALFKLSMQNKIFKLRSNICTHIALVGEFSILYVDFIQLVFAVCHIPIQLSMFQLQLIVLCLHWFVFGQKIPIFTANLKTETSHHRTPCTRENNSCIYYGCKRD